MSNNDSGSKSFLDSLFYYEKLRADHEDRIIREDDSVLDIVLLDENDQNDRNNSTIAFCHIVGILPFTDPSLEQAGKYFILGYEAAMGIALAVQHLNTGDWSVISDIKNLQQQTNCPIKFTLEFIDDKLDAGEGLSEVIAVVNRPNRKPSAFLGAFRSAVSSCCRSIHKKRII
jgi:hypothetical protein